MTRSLPARPSLESDRKRAKALKKAHAGGDPAALQRIVAHHPRFRALAPGAAAAEPFRLADAQLVVAREYGIESWPRLVRVVAFLRADFDERVRLFLEAAVGESPVHAHDLLARAPELATAGLQAACAAGDRAAAEDCLARAPEAATRHDGPLGAPPLWTLCWSGVNLGGAPTEAARVQIAQRLFAAGAVAEVRAERDTIFGRHSFTALYGSVERRQPQLTKTLLEAGASPDDGESLYHATEDPSGRCLKLLVEYGATLVGGNVLHHALDRREPTCLRTLLEAGADPNEPATGFHPGPPLYHAALRGQGAEALDLLARHGAELDARSSGDGRTAYQIARRHGHSATAERLLELGADDALAPLDAFLGACAVGDAASARKLLAGGTVSSRDLGPEDHALLARAAECGRIDAVGAMLDVGFPVDSEGGDWRGTALNHAAWAGHADVVALLLERGADPELENQHGGTALGALAWASSHDRADGLFNPGRSEAQRQRDLVETAEVLVAAGARIQPQHVENASPQLADALLRYTGREPR